MQTIRLLNVQTTYPPSPPLLIINSIFPLATPICERHGFKAGPSRQRGDRPKQRAVCPRLPSSAVDSRSCATDAARSFSQRARRIHQAGERSGDSSRPTSLPVGVTNIPLQPRQVDAMRHQQTVLPRRLASQSRSRSA